MLDQQNALPLQDADGCRVRDLSHPARCSKSTGRLCKLFPNGSNLDSLQNLFGADQRNTGQSVVGRVLHFRCEDVVRMARLLDGEGENVKNPNLLLQVRRSAGRARASAEGYVQVYSR